MTRNNLLYETKKPVSNVLGFTVIVLIFSIFLLNSWIDEQINLGLILLVLGVVLFFGFILLVPVTQYYFYEDYVVIKTPFRLVKSDFILYPSKIKDVVYYINKGGNQFRFYLKSGGHKWSYIHTSFGHRQEFRYALKYFKDRGCKINVRTIFHKYRELEESEW